jgi:hypothetical protein
MFGVHALLPSFYGRSSQHFRNERLRILPSPSPVQRRFTSYADGSAGFESRLPFSHVVDRFPRPFLSRSPPIVSLITSDTCHHQYWFHFSWIILCTYIDLKRSIFVVESYLAEQLDQTAYKIYEFYKILRDTVIKVYSE